MCTGFGINRRKRSTTKTPNRPFRITLLTLEAAAATLEGHLELRQLLLYQLRVEIAQVGQTNL